MDRDQNPGADTEMFRIFVEGGEAPDDERSRTGIVVLIAIVLIAAIAAAVLLL